MRVSSLGSDRLRPALNHFLTSHETFGHALNLCALNPELHFHQALFSLIVKSFDDDDEYNHHTAGFSIGWGRR